MKAKSECVAPREASLGGVCEIMRMFQAACAASHRPAARPTRGSGLGAIIETIGVTGAGITADKLPVCAVSVGEDELRGLDPSKVKGHLAAWNYFQTIDTPQNKEFVKKFQDKYGKDRVTDDPIEAAYYQVYFWKLAVEKAGATDVDKVREALRTGIEFDAPGGKVKVDPETQHTYKFFRMGKTREDKQFDIVYTSPEVIKPDPYPQVAFPGWKCDWTKGGVKRGKEVEIQKKST